ncbi:MAG TPA: hypothetical protein ENK61_04675, partial [Devosia sp.]|nr:hypothetical protein [Devosia sp.]
RLGHQHICNNRLVFTQVKTGKLLDIPIAQELAKEIAANKSNMTFLITEYGTPFSPAGFGNWFRRQCDLANLPKRCSSHGIRKAMSRRMAEKGKTVNQIKSMTGHTTDKEVARYTAAASQKILSDQAITALSETKKEQTNG